MQVGHRLNFVISAMWAGHLPPTPGHTSQLASCLNRNPTHPGALHADSLQNTAREVSPGPLLCGSLPIHSHKSSFAGALQPRDGPLALDLAGRGGLTACVELASESVHLSNSELANMSKHRPRMPCPISESCCTVPLPKREPRRPKLSIYLLGSLNLQAGDVCCVRHACLAYSSPCCASRSSAPGWAAVGFFFLRSCRVRLRDQDEAFPSQSMFPCQLQAAGRVVWVSVFGAVPFAICP